MVFSSTTAPSRYTSATRLVQKQSTDINKVEVLVASADLIPQPKSLGQRITAPKAQPKSAATVKHSAAPKGAAAAKKGKKGPVKAKSVRPAKKTAEELDSEMADYFVGASADGTVAAPAAANGGDAPMEDEVL